MDSDGPSASASSFQTASGLSRSLSQSFIGAPSSSAGSFARPRLPRYRSAPQTDLSDGDDDDGDSSASGRSGSRDRERAALLDMMANRRGSWYESDDDDGDDSGRRGRRHDVQMARAKRSWKELYATLPKLFASMPAALSVPRPPPPRCVLGKAPPAVGLVETTSNQLFEWVLPGKLPAATGPAVVASCRRRGAHAGARSAIRQTSLDMRLPPPFAPCDGGSGRDPAGRSSDLLLLPPWGNCSGRTAASPVGSDTTIRPSQYQQQQQQRQASPARSARSTASSRAQDFAPSSPLARWERRHRRADSTPLPASTLGYAQSRDDYGDLSTSPTGSGSSVTPRLSGLPPHRTSQAGADMVFLPPPLPSSSLLARMSSPPPPLQSTRSHRAPYQHHHPKPPSLSNTISTAPSSLASPSHAPSFRFPSAGPAAASGAPRSRSAMPPLFQNPYAHSTQKDAGGGVVDYRFPPPARRPSAGSTAVDGLPPHAVDIANSSLADLVFASLRASSSSSAAAPTARKPRRPSSDSAGSSSSSSCASSFAVRPLAQNAHRAHFRRPTLEENVFAIPHARPAALLTQKERPENDGLRRSRTTAGSSRRPLQRQPALAGSLC